MDPYGIFDILNIYNLNYSKIKQETNVRIFKSLEVLRKKPKILLLGSSRTDVGLDPRRSALFKNMDVYNLGILGANMYEVMRYFQQGMAVEPNIKQIILGIDFFMFNQNRAVDPSFYEDLLNEKSFWSSFLPWTFSIDTFSASIETIEWNRKGKKLTPYHEYGTRDEQYFIRYNLPKQSKIKGFEATLKGFLEDPRLYKNYELSIEALGYLKEIVETCNQKNIDIYLFISPAHATQWEAIYQSGIWTIFEQWKREIVEISDVWDFSGYNSITTEKISDRMLNYLDSSHYTQKVGELILEHLLNQDSHKVSSDFGIFISKKNIDEHLREIRKQRNLWILSSQDSDFISKITIN
jgi:hypothetical protein